MRRYIYDVINYDSYLTQNSEQSQQIHVKTTAGQNLTVFDFEK